MLMLELLMMMLDLMLEMLRNDNIGMLFFIASQIVIPLKSSNIRR